VHIFQKYFSQFLLKYRGNQRTYFLL
jgi:hypothetical protein